MEESQPAVDLTRPASGDEDSTESRTSRPTDHVRTYGVVEARPEAIVIHCSDPRFQRAFGEFIRNELHLEEGKYVPLVVSGAVGSLSEPLKLPKEFKFMKDRIQLFIDRFDSINRIVLINHEDCRHYEALKDYIGSLFLRHFPTLMERQKSDLMNVAKTLLGLVRADLKIDMYYARFVDGDRRQVVFEQVNM